MYNKVTLIGRLGKDPELSYTNTGKAVCKINLATTEVWLDKEANEKQERTEWHRIVIWGKVGEKCAKYLMKGKLAHFEGKLSTRSWEKDGVKRWTTEIVARNVIFLSPSDAKGTPGSGNGPAASGPSQDESFGEDDIPF